LHAERIYLFHRVCCGQADSLHLALKGDRSKLTDTEATLHQISRQKETEVTSLRRQVEELDARSSKAENTLRDTSSRLSDAEARLRSAIDELAATSANFNDQRRESEHLRETLTAADDEGILS
jgi:hypothetical protein